MDEQFFAWLDGELNPEEAAEVEKRVAADPELSDAAAEHRALAMQLHGAFDPVTQAPIPDRIRSAVRPPSPVTELASWRQRRQSGRPAVQHWAAMAATLAVGIVVGTMVPTDDGSPFELRGGQMVAASALDHALDTQLASAASGDTRIGLTFRDRSGAICRSFENNASSGVACSEVGHWRIHGLFAAPEGQDGSYRIAAGSDPNLAALIETRIAGEPFDAKQEAKARARDWR
ncbi:MAG: hypothetical protein ABIO43_11185 [Sphingomicrobium sp.]